MNGGQLESITSGGSNSDQLMMSASMLLMQQQEFNGGYGHELSAPPLAAAARGQAATDQASPAPAGPAVAVAPPGATSPPSRYESQKRRDWNTFGQFLRNNRPPLALARCSGEHVLQFLRYLDQFGKTKIHAPRCPFFGHPHPAGPCDCPLRQAWGSLDALIGRLRAAFEEHGGRPESNPFGARVVRIYLREVREMQAKARGIAYEKKKRKRPPAHQSPAAAAAGQQLQQLTENPSAGNAATDSRPLYHLQEPGPSFFLIPD